MSGRGMVARMMYLQCMAVVTVTRDGDEMPLSTKVMMNTPAVGLMTMLMIEAKCRVRLIRVVMRLMIVTV